MRNFLPCNLIIQIALLNTLIHMHLAVPALPRSCEAFYETTKKDSSVLSVAVKVKPYQDEYNVYCDFSTVGSPWTVIQRRTGPEVDFYRNWNDYKNGFGCPSGDHWIGNKYLYDVTGVTSNTRLRIELIDWDGGLCWAEYDDFRTSGEPGNYGFWGLGTFSGNCGDSLRFHVRHPFSTYDHLNYPDDCPTRYHGGFWYGKCLQTNLNGPYVNGSGYINEGMGITWLTGKGHHYSYKSSLMKIQKTVY